MKEREQIERRLDALCAKLGSDELRVLAFIGARLLSGQACYGKLRLSRDRRDFRGERAAELGDVIVYGAFDELRRTLRRRAHT